MLQVFLDAIGLIVTAFVMFAIAFLGCMMTNFTWRNVGMSYVVVGIALMCLVVIILLCDRSLYEDSGAEVFLLFGFLITVIGAAIVAPIDYRNSRVRGQKSLYQDVRSLAHRLLR